MISFLSASTSAGLPSAMQYFQKMKGLDKNDIVDENAGVYQFTVQVYVATLCVMYFLHTVGYYSGKEQGCV